MSLKVQEINLLELAMRCCTNIVNALVSIAKVLRRPKRNVPAKPEIGYVMDNEGAIEVIWLSNDEHDGVNQYKVFRDRVFVHSVSGPLPLELSYTDTDVRSGVTYKYHIVATQGPGGDESVPSDIMEGQVWAMG